MEKLTVYYDELCVLCSKEIHHYQKQKGSELIRFVDITAPDFDAQKENVDPFQVHKVMHTKSPDGILHTKVDAFISIWAVLPKYRWLHSLAQNRLIRPALDLGYLAFAEARPYLPRKTRNECAASPYCEVHQQPEKP